MDLGFFVFIQVIHCSFIQPLRVLQLPPLYICVPLIPNKPCLNKKQFKLTCREPLQKIFKQLDNVMLIIRTLLQIDKAPSPHILSNTTFPNCMNCLDLRSHKKENFIISLLANEDYSYLRGKKTHLALFIF